MALDLRLRSKWSGLEVVKFENINELFLKKLLLAIDFRNGLTFDRILVYFNICVGILKCLS